MHGRLFPLQSRRQVAACMLVNVMVLMLLLEGVSMAAPQDQGDPAKNYWNLKSPTLGGKQFWTDHHWRCGWRIQQNALTGHWRLIDADNVRHAWGTREACEATLDQQQPDNSIAGGQLVILLHGLLRSSASMQGLGEFITRETGQSVAYFEYASTRATIREHAAALREVIAGLPADTQLRFIGHSMGNIIVRHALGDWQRAGDQQTLDRVSQVIMLGPPNQGASIARQLAKTGLFGWVAGKGGMELGPQWAEFESSLAIPSCPFGIIAGRLPETLPSNPLVDGASDFVVSVEETKLKDASDFLEVPHMHSFLMDQPVVRQAVLRFLENGQFH